MVLFEDVSEGRPVTGAGVRDIIEEEEEVERPADSTPGPRSDAGTGVDEDAPSPTISSASESAPPPTARDLQRVKRGLVRATETSANPSRILRSDYAKLLMTRSRSANRKH